MSKKNICPKCNYLGTDADVYCPYCGFELISECPECKAEIKVAFAKFCCVCGFNFESMANTGKDDKNKTKSSVYSN